MHCSFCQHHETRVIDSRLIDASNQIRRRRECEHCKERFNTLETAELALPLIIKRDGSRVEFDKQKLNSGLKKAFQKRPCGDEQLEAVTQCIIQQLSRQGKREVSSHTLGEWVMHELRQRDPVAYVRFASVYRSFEDIEAFQHEIQVFNQKD